MLNAGPPRDFIGHGRRPPRVEWPEGARVIVSFVVNYEEGAERNLLDGDTTGEGFGELTDDREIPRCRRRLLRTHRRPFWGAGNFAILCR